MKQMINKAFAVLWCVVVCGSHPHDLKAGLQVNNDNVLRTAPILVDTNQRHKRTTDHHAAIIKFACTISESLRKKCDGLNHYIQPVDPNLLEDSGFLTNLEIVFSPEKNTIEQLKKDSDLSLFSEDILYSNENNTGLDDRVRSKETFYRRYKEILYNSPNELEQSLNNENRVSNNTDDNNLDNARLLKETHKDTFGSSSKVQKTSFYVYFIYSLMFTIFL